MLKTKPIKILPQLSDGRLISVMSRHTLSDGITPDQDISHKYYDEWWKELAPPDVLVGAYYKRELPWDEFENEYKLHLRKTELAEKLDDLIRLALKETVTVMCLEDKPDKCHRRLLAEECIRLEPGLIVEIN